VLFLAKLYPYQKHETRLEKLAITAYYENSQIADKRVLEH
jgi:hypothetical protein